MTELEIKRYIFIESMLLIAYVIVCAAIGIGGSIFLRGG